MPNSTTSTWRDALREAISNLEERERIAHAIGVNPATLLRWCANETNYWKQLRSLLGILPDLVPLVVQDLLGTSRTTDLPCVMPEIQREPEPTRLHYGDEEKTLLPARLYADVLQLARRMTGGRFLAICRRIISHALATLDAQQLGMEVALARCMPPEKGGKVCSLILCLAQGTSPWESHLLTEPTLFFGSESFPGYAVSRQHWMVSPNVTEYSHLLPLKPTSSHEVSVAVFPVMRGEFIAGCLIISSTQAEYFSPIQIELISQYADLLSLGFLDTDFYHPSQIKLRAMPDLDIQREHSSTFRRRVTELLNQTSTSGQSIALSEAELLIRKCIEGELQEMCACSKEVSMS